MKTITIDGRTYIATAVENPQPGDRTITVDGVTYVLREETVGTVTKIVVNDKVYDIADVEEVAQERERAMSEEEAIRAAALQTGVEVKEGKMYLTSKSLDGKTSTSTAFPTASPGNDGAMSAADKRSLDSMFFEVEVDQMSGAIDVITGNPEVKDAAIDQTTGEIVIVEKLI